MTIKSLLWWNSWMVRERSWYRPKICRQAQYHNPTVLPFVGPTFGRTSRASISLVPPYFQFSTTGISMCSSGRLYNCVGCQRQVIICSHCDRGNIYCSGYCSEQSRREKHREAAERYQSSHQGRRLHAQRQQHYRQRQKEKVTHQGSPARTACDSITTGLKTEISQPAAPLFSKKTGFVCHFCGVQCSEYLRWDFLRRRSHSWSPHSVF